MKRNTVKKRLPAFFCALVMLLSFAPAASAAENLTPASSSNKNKQDYTTYGSTVKSHLYADGSGLVRVESINGEVVVETYDSEFALQESRTVPMELSIWGGFFAGEDYNFLVFGQKNPSESDSVEVIRVVKYSKDWRRLGQASLYGANTTVPFDAGSLRCDEYGGYLYIRTSHTMYKYIDGINHQANMTLAVKQSDMSVSDAYYDIWNEDYGYISHSFNQHILVDEDGLIVALDHGDGDPSRGVAFTRYYADAGTGKFTGAQYGRWCSFGLMKAFGGSSGSNTTGGSIGGLGETTDGYVMAYSYDGVGGNGPRAAYYHYMDKPTGRSWSVQLTDTVGVTTPVLAPTGLDGGYVLWNGKSGYIANDTLSYIRYAADGQPGEIQTATAPLSDCRPIYYNGKLVWYVTDNSAPTFYTLDESGVAAISTVASQEPEEPAAPTTPTTPAMPTTPTAPTTPTTPTTPTAPVVPQQPATTPQAGSVDVSVMLPPSTFSSVSALKTDGTLWGWGLQRDNMGRADTFPADGLAYQSRPVQIARDYVAIGPNWGIKADGSLWAWGLRSIFSGNPNDAVWLTEPVKLMDNVAYAELAEYISVVLKTDGSVWGWGLQSDLLGDSSKNTFTSYQQAVKLLDNVKQVQTTGWGWMALKEDGSLWSCGISNMANLNANGYTEGNQLIPLTRVMEDVAAFSLGWQNTLAIKTDGSLWSWGSNVYGQVGNGGAYENSNYNYTWQSTPVKIMEDVVSAKAGAVAYAVTSDGTMYAWGNNKDGALGFSGGNFTSYGASYGGVTCQSTPVAVMDNVAAVKENTVLKRDGSLWSCSTYLGTTTGKFIKLLNGVQMPGQTPAAPQRPANPFTDVPEGTYYHDAALWALENGVTTGVTSTQFQPNGACTRGQVATFLWRAKGEPEPTISNPFTDVSPSSPFYKAILWAYENGITQGTSTTTFNPNGTCSSAHVVTFLWRANGKPAASGSSALANTYPGQYYTDAIAWADSTGLLAGTGKAFTPGAQSPRADIVTYLYRDIAD